MIGFILKNIALSGIMTVVCTSAVIAQPIVSVGEFKIGMTEQEFLATSEISSRTIEEPVNRFKSFKERGIWKQNSESVVPEAFSLIANSWRIYNPNYVKYEFKMGIGVKDSSGKDSYNAILHFYKNELISIDLSFSTSFSEFRDILTEKYGKPIIKDEMKKEICQNGFGARTEYNTGNTTWDWGGKGPIDASLTLTYYNCEKIAGTTYVIKNTKISAMVFDLEKKAMQDAASEEVKKKGASSKL